MTTPDRTTVTVALVFVLGGTAVLTALVYTAWTTGGVEDDYREFSANCDRLANETRIEDAGVGIRRVELNQTAVAVCKNTTLADYRARRRQSFRTTPLGLGQWALYGGTGVVLMVVGGWLLGRQYRRLASQ